MDKNDLERARRASNLDRESVLSRMDNGGVIVQENQGLEFISKGGSVSAVCEWLARSVPGRRVLEPFFLLLSR
jgi:hypothetical protein